MFHDKVIKSTKFAIKVLTLAHILVQVISYTTNCLEAKNFTEKLLETIDDQPNNGCAR